MRISFDTLEKNKLIWLDNGAVLFSVLVYYAMSRFPLSWIQRRNQREEKTHAKDAFYRLFDSEIPESLYSVWLGPRAILGDKI